MNVKKAVIPAAGLRTRFLPATKTVPKELLPIVDKPILLHVVEEAIAAGVEDIVIIAGRQKNAIEDFFDRSYELEDTLAKAGKTDLLAQLRRVQNMVNIISIRQKEALGLGHAVLTARPVVGREPFAVLLGDEIMVNDQDSVTSQLHRRYQETQVSTVAVMQVPEEDVCKYGIIDHAPLHNGLMKVFGVIEKPNPDEAPSQWALPGRYIFNAQIFEYLKSTRPGKNGEIQLTDAMMALAQNEGLNAMEFKAQRFDAGDKLGYLLANIEMGLQHPEVGEKLKNYLIHRAKELS